MSRRWSRIVAAVVLLCAWCGWVSGFHRSTNPARITWACSLLAVVVFGLLLWRGRRGAHPGVRVPPARPRRPPTDPARPAWIASGPWLALIVVAVAWDVLGLDTGSHEPHLTISALTQQFRPLNAAMLLVWMSVGAGYALVRARVPPSWEGGPPLSPVRGRPRRGTAPGGATAAVVTASLRVRAPALLLPASRAVGVVFWVGVVVAGVAIDLVARRSGGGVADGEEFVAWLSSTAVARGALVVAWGYAGYHLFAH